jgi:uncharacterized membrane protein YagU involved in acid resistance
MDSKRLLGGIAGGLAGGVLFGVLMQMMGLIEMVGALIGQDSPAVGWLVHLGISLLFGLGYALIFGAASTSWGRAVAFGAAYGVMWWVLGALLIMPARLGMPVFQLGEMQLQSLVGHLLYGIALGAVFHGLVQALSARSVPSRA